MGMKLLKKITLKDIAGKPDIKALVAFDNLTPQMDAETGQPIPRPTLWLAQIIGVANDYKPGETALGPFVRFLGEFKGTNVNTGESKYASSVIMPGAIPALLYSALKAGSKSVQFGFKIGVHFDDSAAVKYVYDVESLFDMAENDPIALLEMALASGTGKLPVLGAPTPPAGGNGEQPEPPAPEAPTEPQAPTEAPPPPAPPRAARSGRRA